MKRVLSTALFSLLAFSACFSQNTSIATMKIEDTFLSDGQGYVSDFVADVNYDDRTLDISYTVNDAEGESTYEGLVGGEYFDMFEEIVKDYDKGVYGGLEQVGDQVFDSTSHYDVFFTFVDGKQEQIVGFPYSTSADLPEELARFRQLVDEISALLLTEAPV